MEPIPDTGGGISGFIAHWIWHVYRYFPFSPKWNAVLLVISVAAVARALYLPFLCKNLTVQMRFFASRDDSLSAESRCLAFSELLPSACFFSGIFLPVVFFFTSSAGDTFFQGFMQEESDLLCGMAFLLGFLLAFAGVLVRGFGHEKCYRQSTGETGIIREDLFIVSATFLSFLEMVGYCVFSLSVMGDSRGFEVSIILGIAFQVAAMLTLIIATYLTCALRKRAT